MRKILVLSFLGLISCDDHKFSGGHNASVDVGGGGYEAVSAIVSGSCLGCHSDSSASGGLSLEGDLCSATVGVVSPTYGQTLVVPNDHQASVFWHKCADTDEYGQEMPIGAPLPPDQADIIAQWIDDGASCESVIDDTAAPAGIDNDGDGFTSSEDCDDDNMDINPDAEEIWYDDIDQNCDGLSDFDADMDGYESIFYSGTDCNDESEDLDMDGEADGFLINPGAEEIWYDGVDQNCSGTSDYDQDQDGQDSDQHNGLDCDDENNTIFDGAPEIAADGIDQDCDGQDLLEVADIDNDGFDNTVDCDDNDPNINPGQSESTMANGDDDNCDGDIDENTTAFDDDGDCFCEDGFQGVCTGSADSQCTSPQTGDCDDASAVRFPSASESYYDGIDSDCDNEDYPFDLVQGESVFFQANYCNGCHYSGVDLSQVVPPLSAEGVYLQVTNGGGYMPNFSSGQYALSQADRVSVAEYVWLTYQ